jgi:hypothetical protein
MSQLSKVPALGHCTRLGSPFPNVPNCRSFFLWRYNRQSS